MAPDGAAWLQPTVSELHEFQLRARATLRVVLRATAYVFVASTAVFLATTVLIFTTTDGNGCENGCNGYERGLIDGGPVFFWLSILSGAVAVVVRLGRRRSVSRRADSQ